jgi:ferrous iron transport protein A
MCVKRDHDPLGRDGLSAVMLAPNRTLDHEPLGRPAVIQRVVAPELAAEWAQRLSEIGFIPGERVMITARGLSGSAPMAVRVGTSTFALRRAEAACIHLVPDEPLK